MVGPRWAYVRVFAAACLLLGSAGAAEPAAAAAGSEAVTKVRHEPLGTVAEGEPAVVKCRVEGAWMDAAIELRWRLAGEKAFRTRVLERSETGEWVTQIPAAELTGPWIEYYLVSVDAGGRERLHFGSPELPHAAIVAKDAKAERTRELLRRVHGARSRFSIRSELVNFGVPEDGPGARVWYLLGEADYTYRVLGPIHQIRFGVGLFRGARRPGAGSKWLPPDVEPDKLAGFNWGFAEARFRLASFLFLDARAIFGAGPERFEGGGGGGLVVGNDPGTHFDVYFEGITSIGVRAFLRLAWATVPGFPMSLAIELSTLPDAALDAETSGRVIFTVGHRFGDHLTVDLSGSYGSRDFGLGSFGGGLQVGVEF